MFYAKIIFIKIVKNKLTINSRILTEKNENIKIIMRVKQSGEKIDEVRMVPLFDSFYENNYELNQNKLSFEWYYCDNQNNYYPISLDFEYYSPVSNYFKNSFYYCDKYKISCNYSSLFVDKYNYPNKYIDEIKFRIEILLKSPKKLLLLFLRSFAIFIKKHKRKKILLFYDRIDRGDDNAEFLYNYFNNDAKQNNVKTYFLIDKNHYKNYKNTIKFFTFKEKLLFLVCDIKISSHAAHYTNFPFEKDINIFRDILNSQKFIYLQHGVIKDDMAKWLNKYRRNIYSIIVSSEFEKQLLLDNKYLYNNNNIWLTGMPRYDYLRNTHSEKIILVAFTWRKYLMSDNFDTYGNRNTIEDFKNSVYYQKIHELLCNKDINRVLQESGYKFHFKIHPMFREYINLFPKTNNIVYEIGNEYISIINKSSILITDYSSISFDFAYLNKPIIYYQFDYDEFYSGIHTYSKGKYSFNEMGFGKIAFSISNVINELKYILENSSEMSPLYKKRAYNFFKYHDQSNCKRIYNQILFSLDNQ